MGERRVYDHRTSDRDRAELSEFAPLLKTGMVPFVDDFFSAPPAFRRRLLPDSGERDGHDSKLPDQCECEASGPTPELCRLQL